MYKEDMTTPRTDSGYGYNDGNGCGCEGSLNSRSGTCDSCEKSYTESYGTMDGYACGYERTWGLMGYPVGIVFASLQRFDNIHDLDTAMKKGTIFAELDLPFECGNSKKGGCCND